jgi:FlaA1/EpsC-like NDP-sugar epimerase
MQNTRPARTSDAALRVVAPFWAIQIPIFILSGVLAFVARFEFALDREALVQMAWAIPVWIVVKSAVYRAHQLDRDWWRFASVPDMVRIGLANLTGSILSAIILLVFAPPGFPRSIYLMDFLLAFNATAGVRLLARIMHDSTVRGKVEAARRRVLVYGAGTAGAMLLRELRANPRLAYDVRGFIDDDRLKLGMRVQLVPVLGVGADLAAVARRHGIEEVLVAIPSASGPAMAAILEQCHRAGLPCKTIPGMAELIEGRRLAPQIRDVAVEDLLGRVAISLDESALREKLEQKVVLVTGAAGSIGSEICRQVTRFHPAAIVGFDVAETPLFNLEQEMQASFPDVNFRPEIGCIRDRARLRDVMGQYQPSILYHAAAYKHVPMMESNILAAVDNNIHGTANVVAAAMEQGVADFVMISSDKAVRPTSIMGLTKRVAELLIGSIQDGGTKFVSVRFGNVLGSNGSVIPIFKKQIAAGGPVTVTHPEMRRYFMTIPEAVQLVMQASTMGKGGEIFVLDMGQPVKIVDLARNLILLSGLRPDDDIRIEFTGVRPGEKLYEELNTLEENTAPTFHNKIKIFTGPTLSCQEMETRLETVRGLLEVRDERTLLLELKDLVPDYNPSKHVLERLLGRRKSPASVSPAGQTAVQVA